MYPALHGDVVPTSLVSGAPRAVALALSAGILLNTALLAGDRGHDPMREVEFPGRAEPVVATPQRVVALVAQGDHLGLYLLTGPTAVAAERFPRDAVVLLVSGEGRYAFAAANGSDRTTRVHSSDDSEIGFVVPGTPRALAVARGLLAVGMEGNDTVHVARAGEPVSTYATGASVNAVAAAEGVVAWGTSSGRIEVRGAGSHSMQTRYAVADLSLSQDGRYVLVGGRALDTGIPPGAAFLFDLHDAAFRVPRWSFEAAHAVTFVEITGDGSLAVALSEAPGQGLVEAFEVATGRTLFRYAAPGTVGRLGIGGQGGVAMDVRTGFVAVATLDSDVVLLSPEGRVVWKTGLRGSSSVSFHDGTLVANHRSARGAEYDRVSTLNVSTEPWIRDVAWTLPVANGTLLASVLLFFAARQRRLKEGGER